MLFYDIKFITMPRIKYNCSMKTRGGTAPITARADLLELCYVESGDLICETPSGTTVCEAGHLYPLVLGEGVRLYSESGAPARITSLGIECEMSVRTVNTDAFGENDTRTLMRELIDGDRLLIPKDGMSILSLDWLEGYIKRIRACRVGERIAEETRAIATLLELFSRITRSSMDAVAYEKGAFPTSAVAYSEMAVAYIVKHYREKITVADIADELGLSQNYLHSIFKQVKGCTITDYLTSYRMGLARTYIERFGLKSYEAAHAVGIDDPAYFSRLFKKSYGISASEMKKEL